MFLATAFEIAFAMAETFEEVKEILHLKEVVAEVLAGIWAATSLSVAERRRLCARVVTTPTLAAAGLGMPAERDGGRGLVQLEEAFEVVQEIAGGSDRPTVTVAKAELRCPGQDGCHLACWLGRLSKARSTFAHLDVGLVGPSPGCRRGWLRRRGATPAPWTGTASRTME